MRLIVFTRRAVFIVVTLSLVIAAAFWFDELIVESCLPDQAKLIEHSYNVADNSDATLDKNEKIPVNRQTLVEVKATSSPIDNSETFDDTPIKQATIVRQKHSPLTEQGRLALEETVLINSLFRVRFPKVHQQYLANMSFYHDFLRFEFSAELATKFTDFIYQDSANQLASNVQLEFALCSDSSCLIEYKYLDKNYRGRSYNFQKTLRQQFGIKVRFPYAISPQKYQAYYGVTERYKTSFIQFELPNK